MKHRDVILIIGFTARVVRHRILPMRKSRQQGLWNSGRSRNWN